MGYANKLYLYSRSSIAVIFAIRYVPHLKGKSYVSCMGDMQSTYSEQRVMARHGCGAKSNAVEIHIY
jgi:hypothetical protein